MGLRRDIGIDLGTSSVLIYIRGKGIVVNEPTVIALDQYTKEIVAVGHEAKQMLGKTPGNIVAKKPLNKGVISDFDTTEKLLEYFIKKGVGQSFLRPRLVICVPSGITNVEKRAVLEAGHNLGVSQVSLIEEPIASAIGAGLDITEPYGHMVVDIGGGTTDIAVIALGSIVVSKSIALGGNNFNDAIVRYIRLKFNLMIGEQTAENIKHHLASVYPEEEVMGEVRGRDMETGLPISISLSNRDIYSAIKGPMEDIILAIKSVLEETAPELAADIADRGILISGGGALLNGLDKLIKHRTGIQVHIAPNPMETTVRGTGRSLKWIGSLKKNTGLRG